MAAYERIPYSSFLWKLGTTSFRTREFNKMTEWQLRLLDEFWQKPENHNQGWEIAVPGQADIYEIKNRYYDWLVENDFTKGNDKVKYKAAREKTSGLYDMGFIDNEHRLTEVGYELLEVASSNDYLERNQLGISHDSQIYLAQLLKLSDDNTGTTVRPFIIVLHLLSELDYLSYDEFRYLMPLCTDEFSTSYILHSIVELREGKGDIDSILKDFLLSKKNYQVGLQRFTTNEFSEELLLSVGMNRKSSAYDMSYVPFYFAMHAIYMEHDNSRIFELFNSIKKFQSSIGIKWKQLLFDTSLTSAVKAEPIAHLLPLPETFTASEEEFKKFFFLTMHLYKAKATLEDYLDLNRRYLGLTNCFLFEDSEVKLDIVPKQFFKGAMSELYKQAYQDCDLLFVNCPMELICPSLEFNERKVIDGLNQELGTHLGTIDDAFNEVDRIRYDRFNKIIDQKFTSEKLLRLLDDFDNRNDDEISQMVTDNADIPTIFEYVLGIIWYKASGREGNVLSYLKLSLDANLLPVTHAAGGEADIVYEYRATPDYPAHSLLLEATLADSTNQRRMEMEPVSRHLGNHLLRKGNRSSYCVFATSYLHINVISDFMSRKHIMYCDTQDTDRYVDGMKIIPLSTTDLRTIITFNLQYKMLYKHFEKAYQHAGGHPQKWYDEYVNIASMSTLEKPKVYHGMVAEGESTQQPEKTKTLAQWMDSEVNHNANTLSKTDNDAIVLLGCIRNVDHFKWIFRKGTYKNEELLYNVRQGARYGAVKRTSQVVHAKYALLYNLDNPKQYLVFRLNETHYVWDEDKMKEHRYDKPHGMYYVYKLEEQVQLSNVQVADIIKKANVRKGTPLYMNLSEICSQ